jgi:hypothetical protein
LKSFDIPDGGPGVYSRRSLPVSPLFREGRSQYAAALWTAADCRRLARTGGFADNRSRGPREEGRGARECQPPGL